MPLIFNHVYGIVHLFRHDVVTTWSQRRHFRNHQQPLTQFNFNSQPWESTETVSGNQSFHISSFISLECQWRNHQQIPIGNIILTNFFCKHRKKAIKMAIYFTTFNTIFLLKVLANCFVAKHFLVVYCSSFISRSRNCEKNAAAMDFFSRFTIYKNTNRVFAKQKMFLIKFNFSKSTEFWHRCSIINFDFTVSLLLQDSLQSWRRTKATPERGENVFYVLEEVEESENRVVAQLNFYMFNKVMII